MSMKVIRRLLKNFFKKFGTDSNVVDVVANLIKTDEKYEEAVSTIAGARLQNVVIKKLREGKGIFRIFKAKHKWENYFFCLWIY